VVRIGFGLPVSGAWATPQNQAAVARRAEELGYATLWTFQRLVVPAKPDGRSASPAYRSVYDPIVSLAYVASLTERIRLGIAVINMPFLSPALLAKQLTTLDLLSNGRLDAGLGIGWSREEYAASGVPYKDRGARAEEFIQVLRSLWTDDPVEFRGRFYDIPPSRMQPKPLQRPYPPILLGGSADRALRRAGRIADGWISASSADPAWLGEAVATITIAAREAGRDPAQLRFVARCPVRVGPKGGSDRAPYTGDIDQVRGDLQGLEARGITEAFIDLNWDPEIGAPDADPEAALRKGREVLEAFAPS
jgi:probable F420-dependent oxidoreductase